ncbi:MAG: bcrC [Frankiales bacterium]|nr:bcrC [Frankiales bacterium]
MRRSRAPAKSGVLLARTPDPRTVAGIGIAALLLFCVLLSMVATRSHNNRVDEFVAARVDSYARHNDTAVRAARAMTFFGSTMWLSIVVILSTFVFCLRRRPVAGCQLIGVALVSSGAVAVVKRLVARPRPLGGTIAHAAGYAFPSGHATNSTAIYGMLTMLVLGTTQFGRPRRALEIGTGVLIIVIAASRVVLGVHWVTDVIAGIALGVFIDAAAWFFLRRYRTLRWRPGRGETLPRSSALM